MRRVRAGDWVEVLAAEEIAPTLDQHGRLEGLPFMPEMLRFAGRRFRVRQRAERTCVHPPQFPFPRLSGCLTLVDLRCDGSAHGGCQLGCTLFWKEAWLRPVEGPGAAPGATDTDRSGGGQTGEQAGAARPATVSGEGQPNVYTCQGTELARVTTPGEPLWKPLPYLRLVRDRTFTPAELAGVLGRIVSRKLVAVASWGGDGCSTSPGSRVLGLHPGEWVKVKSVQEIRRTLDPAGRLGGLAFGGDMVRDCGRTFRVRERVERIIDERNGRLRAVADTVLLEGSLCDRYLGCARGMPVLWREAWLQRAAEPAGAGAG